MGTNRNGAINLFYTNNLKAKLYNVLYDLYPKKRLDDQISGDARNAPGFETVLFHNSWPELNENSYRQTQLLFFT